MLGQRRAYALLVCLRAVGRDSALPLALRELHVPIWVYPGLPEGRPDGMERGRRSWDEAPAPRDAEMRNAEAPLQCTDVDTDQAFCSDTSEGSPNPPCRTLLAPTCGQRNDKSSHKGPQGFVPLATSSSLHN